MSASQAFAPQNFGDYYSPGSGSSFFSGGSAPSFDWSKAKAENPFGTKTSAYTLKKDYDFDSDLSKSAFGGKQSESKPGWKEAYDLSSKFLDKATEKGERDETMRNLPYALGMGSRGSGGQVFEGFGYINPTQHGPIVVPNVAGGGGGKSAGQRIAGGLGGAFQGFLAGAATGMPHMAGIGAIAGGVTGAL